LPQLWLLFFLLLSYGSLHLRRSNDRSLVLPRHLHLQQHLYLHFDDLLADNRLLIWLIISREKNNEGIMAYLLFFISTVGDNMTLIVTGPSTCNVDVLYAAPRFLASLRAPSSVHASRLFPNNPIIMVIIHCIFII
jgi:hypothetical protein